MKPLLTIRLTEKKDAAILDCERPDGSRTWTKLRPELVFHDLAHYAVESVCGFHHAFYGLLGRGYSIEAFALPRDERPVALLPANLPAEALYTEHLVNLLQVYSGSGDADGLLAALNNILEEQELVPPVALDSGGLSRIQGRLEHLLKQWDALRPGGQLILLFLPGSQ